MTDEERQQWLDKLDEQIRREEKRLHGLHELLEQGRETPPLRAQFNRLSARLDILIKWRRDLELRHYDFVPVPKQRRLR